LAHGIGASRAIPRTVRARDRALRAVRASHARARERVACPVPSSVETPVRERYKAHGAAD
jgi:hypothetical protein